MRTTIQPDDANVVDHLDEEHDVIAVLEDLNVVVVGAREHRRSGVQS